MQVPKEAKKKREEEKGEKMRAAMRKFFSSCIGGYKHLGQGLDGARDVVKVIEVKEKECG